MSALEAYFHELTAVRSSGGVVPETSHYRALADLLDAVGRTLRPRVRCFMGLADLGAGLPDGGLFTVDQLQASGGEMRPEVVRGQLPARGAIEVKPPSEDTRQTAASAQVRDYCGRYGQVLVTNLREFVLVVRGADGQPVVEESYRIADREASFWTAAARPRVLARQHAALLDFLKRAILRAAQLSEPEDVAWLLASYAKDARARIDQQPIPALGAVKEALEEALGIKFSGAKGEALFRSSLVQTLFYGVFSAWTFWHKERGRPAAEFDWRLTTHYLHLPILRVLFHEVSEPGRLQALRLYELLGRATDVLNRVDASFHGRFQEAQAVQYFYEPFLQAFDPELRKAYGVWYTPPEVVRYMVARVDTVLREELGLERGSPTRASMSSILRPAPAPIWLRC